MAAPVNVIYFGDQAVEPLVSLADLLREASKSELLRAFLRNGFEALQVAVSSSAPADRRMFQGRDFVQLVDHVQTRQIRHAAVSSVLSCVAQLGWLVLHRERQAEIWAQKESTVVGICTGSLVAITAIAARSDSDLLQLTPLIIQISLRLSIEVSQRSFALEASSDPWSAGVSGVAVKTVKEELRQYNESRHTSGLKQVYVSAQSATSVTLSGPPTLLQGFLSSGSLRGARKLPLPIYGAFHAAHLSLPDLSSIIGDAPLLDRSVPASGSLLHPRVTQQHSLRDLLLLSIEEILQKPLDLDDDLRQISQRTAGRDVRLTSIGPARMSHLERALKPSEVSRFGCRQLQSPQDLPALNVGESIAIVGMAGRFPGAENVDELWKSLVEGQDQHRLVPVDRFDVNSHVDQSGKTKNTSLTPYGCFYDGVGNFDISLFKMSPREAAQTDPMQRLMLLTAYEALESSGYYDTGDSDIRPKNGTFYGVAGDDYRQANSSQDVDTNYITGGTRAFGPGRVSYYFGWEGPSMSVDTACSASAVAMHQAIASLKLKDCDVALSGGANLLTCSDMFAGLSRAKFVNTTGPCKTFDETADGYCRADGFATVVFKRLGDAIRDKDNILGVIRSVETNHAGTAISLTHPEADTQIALFRTVLSAAGMTVDDIDHIELHGTGTQAGDLAESTSVTGLLDQPRPKDRPLTISSVKPNVGHSEAASGITSLIKGVLMLQHQMIPQHIGVKTRINPKLPAFDDFGVVVPRENMPYRALAKDGTRRMLVNNFNATGGITAMLLEEYKQKPLTAEDTRGFYPITLSAATMTALQSSVARLLEFLKVNPQTDLSHLSYTLTARRLHHKHRFSCVVKSVDDLIQRLKTEIATPTTRQAELPYGVFVFTGQTSVIPRAKDFFHTNVGFRNHVSRSNQLCVEMGLPSFVEVITDECAEYRPVQLQLALVALEVAVASLFQQWGIHAQAVIGHSLGEYAALCVSGVLSLSDTLWLVGQRGLLLESKANRDTYFMAVVAVSASEAVPLLQSFPRCEISCLNSPQQTVFSGENSDVEDLMSHLASVGIKATKLRTAYGFHSRQMDSILEDYRQVTHGITFKKPSIPFVSTLLGEVVRDGVHFNEDYLCRQTREPVQFEKALRSLDKFIETGQKAFWVELGPTPACLPMIASTLRAKPAELAPAFDAKKPSWATVSNVCSTYYSKNGSVRWDEFHKEYLDGLRLLQLPSYPFDLKRYWIQYDGDWMIRKNQKPVRGAVAAAPKLNLDSSTLHGIDMDSTEKGVRKLTFVTELANLDLRNLFQHTKIDGRPSCTGSLYADMAMTAASYLNRDSGGSKEMAMQLADMIILGSPPTGASTLQTSASRNPTDTNEVHISITCSHTREKIDLARCRVIIGDGDDWKADANGSAYLYQSRMDLLQLFMANGQSSRLLRHNAQPLVEYDEASSGIEEIVINASGLEAVGRIRITAPIAGRYVCSPEWLETLLQLPTILLSSSRGVFHRCLGWSSMTLLMPLQVGTSYRAHVRMQPRGQSDKMIGDIHVLDGSGSAVAIIKQALFGQISSRNTSPTQSKDVLSAPRIIKHYDSDGPRPVYTAQPNPLPTPALRQQTMLHEDDMGPPTQSSNSTLFAINASDFSHEGQHLPIKNISLPPSLPSEIEALQSPQPTIAADDDGMTFEAIIGIIAAEIGVEPDVLTDEIMLEDLGVDSIIQLSVVARLQECIPQPLPPAFLIKNNSVAKLRTFFADPTQGWCVKGAA